MSETLERLESPATVDLLTDTVLRLSKALGLVALDRLPGLWEYRIDQQWHISINGHRDAVEFEREGMMGWTVESVHIVVHYNGWVAGDFLPIRGGWFADGEGANPETFAEAVRSHIKELKP